MALWTGFLDKSGSPALKVSISGPFESEQEFDAIIDTGFTGFVSMPLLKAFPLGLLLYGTTEVTLADGSVAPKLMAKGAVTILDEKQVGVVILEPSSGGVLLGMDFLKKFERVLVVSQGGKLVILVNQTEFDAMSARSAKQPAELTAPQGKKESAS